MSKIDCFNVGSGLRPANEPEEIASSMSHGLDGAIFVTSNTSQARDRFLRIRDSVAAIHREPGDEIHVFLGRRIALTADRVSLDIIHVLGNPITSDVLPDEPEPTMSTDTIKSYRSFQPGKTILRDPSLLHGAPCRELGVSGQRREAALQAIKSDVIDAYEVISSEVLRLLDLKLTGDALDFVVDIFGRQQQKVKNLGFVGFSDAYEIAQVGEVFTDTAEEHQSRGELLQTLGTSSSRISIRGGSTGRVKSVLEQLAGRMLTKIGKESENKQLVAQWIEFFGNRLLSGIDVTPLLEKLRT